MLQTKKLTCDLCVVGGGLSGMVAAISAAREGLRVVLMHERPVLGGNASSEIRMWICGARGRDNRETGIIEEIMLESLYRNPTKSFAIWDTVLYDFVRREKNITLLLNCTCMDAETVEGVFPYGRDRQIQSVTGYQMTTQQFWNVSAKLFCDSSGDSILAPLTGAAFRMGRESKYEFGEDTALTESDGMTMGMSCLIQGREHINPVKFTPPSWKTPLSAENFEKRNIGFNSDYTNYWWLELGGNRTPIEDTEINRDELIPLALGTWDYIKNSGNVPNSENWDLDFVGFLPGKRESRRMCGEYIITQQDICSGHVFEDEIAFGGWPLDDHYPGGFFLRGKFNTNIETPAPYSIPYRCLYSSNVDNLFFAGRNISMTHMAMSSMRVMATCALLGEAVGKAAALAIEGEMTPHDVYLFKRKELQALLMDEDCFLPNNTRVISELCKAAVLNVDGDILRNGQDRAHQIYGTDETNGAYFASPEQEIIYTFPPQVINAVHLVFCSDLNRDTLPGGLAERSYVTRANQKLTSPQTIMPKTLCKDFKLYGERNGVRTELLSVINNRKRSYHIKPGQLYDQLILVPMNTWGEQDSIPIISFDFR